MPFKEPSKDICELLLFIFRYSGDVSGKWVSNPYRFLETLKSLKYVEMCFYKASKWLMKTFCEIPFHCWDDIFQM